MDVDLESARNVFGERVKELSAAVAKVDALTRQLEELRKGNTSNSYHVASHGNTNPIKFNQEFEKLRQELLVSEIILNPNLIPITFDTSAVPISTCPMSVLRSRVEEKSFEPKEK